MRDVARWFSNAVAFAGEHLRTMVFAGGLALTAYGLALVSVAAACIVPGSILMWLAIPPAVKRSK